MQAGETRFVRILPSGGRDITVAIARGLSVEDEVAERLKRGEAVEGSEATPAQALEIAMQRATQFVDEIRSSLEFYTAQTQGARIDRLLVSGGGSKLEGFIEILRQRIPVTVEPGRVFSRVGSQLSLSEDAQNEAEPVLATAVGLGDPVERLVSQVNLLPPDILAAQRQRRLAGVVALAGIGVIGLILVFYVIQLGNLSGVRSDIEAQQQSNQSLQSEIDSLREFEELRAGRRRSRSSWTPSSPTRSRSPACSWTSRA